MLLEIEKTELIFMTLYLIQLVFLYGLKIFRNFLSTIREITEEQSWKYHSKKKKVMLYEKCFTRASRYYSRSSINFENIVRNTNVILEANSDLRLKNTSESTITFRQREEVGIWKGVLLLNFSNNCSTPTHQMERFTFRFYFMPFHIFCQ